MTTTTITRPITIATTTVIHMAKRGQALIRSSPRKRGPRIAGTEPAALASRLRGNEREDAGPIMQAALYRLMTWFSPAYPVGAFSYSSGLEWAVEAGDIHDAETLRLWLAAVLNDGAGINDGIFFVHAYCAVTGNDDAKLVDVAGLAAAFAPTRERHLETTAQGRAFMDVTRAAWPCVALNKLKALWDGPVAYPVAAGVACAGHDIPLATALRTFIAAITANWVSAGVRLIPLGQTDSQRVLKALEPAVAAAAHRAQHATLDELGSATFRADLASARHETQYTRLFRS
jgi:urease accessory protein